MSNLTTWLSDNMAFRKTFTPRALMIGDAEAVAADLLVFAAKNGVTVLSFGENAVEIIRASGAKETVGYDFRTLESIIGTCTNILVMGGTLVLPEKVLQCLKEEKCVCFYGNLWGIDATVRYRILSGLIRPETAQQYDSKNLIAHVATRTKEQALSEKEIAAKYFNTEREWTAD